MLRYLHKWRLFSVKWWVTLVVALVGFASAFDDVDSGIAEMSRFDVSWSLDLPLTLGTSVAAVVGQCLYSGMDVDENIKSRSDLLPWDRPFAGRYSEMPDLISHYAGALAVVPVAWAGVALYRGDMAAREFGAFSLMFVQALSLANGINLAVRALKVWPRPYIYAESGAGAEKAADAEGEAYGSFFSGHAASAFTVAVFTGAFFSKIYPNSPYKSLVWVSSLSLAGLVGVLRIAAGKHYPSDVLVGALVGAGVSAAILKIHSKKCKNVSFWAIPGSVGVLFSL